MWVGISRQGKDKHLPIAHYLPNLERAHDPYPTLATVCFNSYQVWAAYLNIMPLDSYIYPITEKEMIPSHQG